MGKIHQMVNPEDRTERFYPRTLEEAVVDLSGNSLSSKLESTQRVFSEAPANPKEGDILYSEGSLTVIPLNTDTSITPPAQLQLSFNLTAAQLAQISTESYQGRWDYVCPVTVNGDEWEGTILGDIYPADGNTALAFYDWATGEITHTFPADGTPFTIDIPETVDGTPVTSVRISPYSSVMSSNMQVTTGAPGQNKEYIDGAWADRASVIDTVNDALSNIPISPWIPGTGSGSAVLSGSNNSATGRGAVAEGSGSRAPSQYSHAEGCNTTASNMYSHTEGSGSLSLGLFSHAEGRGARTEITGTGSHAEGSFTSASGYCSHAEGAMTRALGRISHAEGQITVASGNYSHAEGSNTHAKGSGAHAEGEMTSASGISSHAEGSRSLALGYGSHAEGYLTIASGNYSHVEGSGSIASGYAAHAEGEYTTASGNFSHAEGTGSLAYGAYSHAEGYRTTASGEYSHAEGIGTKANDGHAEGFETVANGVYSHAEGYRTTASGYADHAEGGNTETSNFYEHAGGFFNSSSAGQIFSIGVGKYNSSISAYERKNAISIITGSGEASTASIYIYGVGGYNGTNPTPGTNDLATIISSLTGSQGGLTSESDPFFAAKSASLEASASLAATAIQPSVTSSWATAAANSHTHDNKTVLDNITAAKTASWDSAATDSHTHTNKAVLDNITAAKTASWDGKQDTITDLAAIRASASLAGTNGAWITSNSGSIHTHTNKTVLDGITAAKTASWEASGTLAKNLTAISASLIASGTLAKNVTAITASLVASASVAKTASSSAAAISAKTGSWDALVGLPAVTAADNGKILRVVNGAWALVDPVTIYSGQGTPAQNLGTDGDIYLQS